MFPGLMNMSLSIVCPIVSLSAAHLKGVHNGTMYVASVLLGATDVYPIGFMLAKGNDDGSMWTTFLTLMKEACQSFRSKDSTMVWYSLNQQLTIDILFCLCQIGTRVESRPCKLCFQKITPSAVQSTSKRTYFRGKYNEVHGMCNGKVVL